MPLPYTTPQPHLVPSPLPLPSPPLSHTLALSSSTTDGFGSASIRPEPRSDGDGLAMTCSARSGILSVHAGRRRPSQLPSDRATPLHLAPHFLRSLPRTLSCRLRRLRMCGQIVAAASLNFGTSLWVQSHIHNLEMESRERTGHRTRGRLSPLTRLVLCGKACCAGCVGKQESADGEASWTCREILARYSRHELGRSRPSALSFAWNCQLWTISWTHSCPVPELRRKPDCRMLW